MQDVDLSVWLKNCRYVGHILGVGNLGVEMQIEAYKSVESTLFLPLPLCVSPKLYARQYVAISQEGWVCKKLR